MKILLAFVALLAAANAAPAEPLEVLRYGPVNDSVVDAVTPGGLVRTPSGDLLTTFTDKGDSAAGSKCYFVRSADGGQTWGEPYLVVEPRDPKEGIFTGLATLPDGRTLMTLMRIAHSDTTRESVFGYRETTVELKVSDDDGATFSTMGFLDTAPGALTSVMGTVYPLKNGDLILPAYAYASGPRQHPGYRYGSGFFRSLDGGKRWGPMEVAFKDPPNEAETRQSFNESAFAVREDGTVIAYARVDIHQGDDYRENRMWRTQSNDHGLTWTDPEETELTGIYPAIITLPSGEFVMACGLRDSPVMRRTTSLFTSSDGIHWAYRGHPHYSRTKGLPANSATGGSQALVPMGGNTVYLVFYAHDPQLPGWDKTYIDGNLLAL